MPPIDALTGMYDALRGVAKAAHEVFTPTLSGLIAKNPLTGRWLHAAQMYDSQSNLDQLPFADAIAPALIEHVQHSDGVVIKHIEDSYQYQCEYTRKHAIHTVVAWMMGKDDASRCIVFLYFKEHYHPSHNQQEEIALFIQQATSILHEYWLQWPYHLIARIEQSINHTVQDAQSLYYMLLSYVEDVFGPSYTCFLAVYPRQGHMIDIWVNEGKRIVVERDCSLENDACHYAIETKQVLFIEHLSQEIAEIPCDIRHIEYTDPKESFIFVPLVLRDDTFGVLSIQHAEPHALSKKALPIIKLLANYVVLALRNISLYDNLESLNTTGFALTQFLEFKQLLKSTIEKIREDARADVIVLYLFDAKRHTFILPPYIGGTLLASNVESMYPRRDDDIVQLMTGQRHIIFAKDSSTLYEEHLKGNVHARQGSFERRENIHSTVAASLRLQDEIVGVIFLNFRKKQRFDEAQKLFIAALTNFAAISIKFASTFDILEERHAQEQHILQQIENEVSHSLDLEHVLDIILQDANELIHADGASIFLYNPGNDSLEAKSVLGHIAEPVKSLALPLRDNMGIVRKAFIDKKPIRVSNVNDEEWRDIYMPSLATGSRSELDVPLLKYEESVGVLNFESRREGAFSREDERFLVVLAAQIVHAVIRAQDYTRLKRAADESYSLNIVSRDIIGQLDSQVSFHSILTQGFKLMDASLGSLHIYNFKTGELEMKAQKGADPDRQTVHQTLHEGIVGHVARTMKSVNADLTKPEWQHIYMPFAKGIQSELAVPMVAHGVLRGVLNFESRNLRHFTIDDEKLLKRFADLAVVALEHAEHYQRALQEKRNFELLFNAEKALGQLSTIEQLEEAYHVTCQLAEAYGLGHVQFIRAEAVLQTDEIHRQLVIVRSNGTVYGYLSLLSDTSSSTLAVDKIPLLEGLAQLLASTIDRLETTYWKQKAEVEALSNERMAWVGSLFYIFPHERGTNFGLVPAYVTDVLDELRRLGVENEYINSKLSRITTSVQKQLLLNKKIVHLVRSSANITLEEVHPLKLFEMVRNNIDFKSRNMNIHIVENAHIVPVMAIPEVAVSVLQNLVINGMDAMSHGGTITLSTSIEGGFVCLDVSDTGAGIPREIQKIIFKLGKSTKGGSGFGLWGGQFAAQRMKGKLELLKSDQGIGTTFRLSLLRATLQDTEDKNTRLP